MTEWLSGWGAGERRGAGKQWHPLQCVSLKRALLVSCNHRTCRKPGYFSHMVLACLPLHLLLQSTRRAPSSAWRCSSCRAPLRRCGSACWRSMLISEAALEPAAWHSTAPPGPAGASSGMCQQLAATEAACCLCCLLPVVHRTSCVLVCCRGARVCAPAAGMQGRLLLASSRLCLPQFTLMRLCNNVSIKLRAQNCGTNWRNTNLGKQVPGNTD